MATETYNGYSVKKTGGFYNDGKQAEYEVLGTKDSWGFTLRLVKCAKCKEFVSTSEMWIDVDGSQKHQACLSEARLKQIRENY